MTKRTKSKNGAKQNEDASLLLDAHMPQAHGLGEYALPGLLFLIFILGGSTVCWFSLQQQSSIDQLTQSYSALQMRMTKFQLSMGVRDAQTGPGTQIEERLQALEETHRQAQSTVAVALETTQQLKSSDLSSQVWSLHAEMDARQAEVEQASVSMEALKAAVRNKSEEIDAVKRTVTDILSANSALAVSMSGLAGAVAGLEAKLHDQVDAVAGLTAGLQGQASELGELTVSMDLHKVALEANNQQFGEIKELLMAEQTRRAMALEEQLQSVKRTLDDQLSSSQNLHSNLKAQLEAVQSQITNGALPGSDPEEVEPLTEEVPPLAEEEQESSSLGEEQESSSLGEEPESSSLGEEPEATEVQDKETVEEELVELAPVDEGAGQQQEVEPEPEPVEQQETDESSEVTGEEEQGDVEETSEEEVVVEEQASVEEELVELSETMTTQEELA